MGSLPEKLVKIPIHNRHISCTTHPPTQNLPEQTPVTFLTGFILTRVVWT
jgi:hypothetical protein